MNLFSASRLPLDSTRSGLLIILTVFAAYYAVYSTAATANVAYLSWFAEIPIIDRYFEGTLRVSDLVQRYGEHGLFGYNVLVLLNVRLFRLNAFFDAYVNVVVVTTVGVIAAVAYVRTLRDVQGSTAKVLLFLPIALALFSVAQRSSGAMETQVRLGTLFCFFASFLIDRTLFDQRRLPGVAAILGGVAAVAAAVLVFGTLYSFAWLPAAVAVCLYGAAIRPAVRIYAFVVATALVMSVPAYFWFYDYHLSIAPSPLPLAARLLYIVQSVLGSLSSATLSGTLWEDRYIQSHGLILVNGIFIAAAYVCALWLWVRTRMIRLTWLPVLMIASSVGVACLVAVGRAGFMEWTGGTSWWYSVHTKFGLAGSLWIYAYIMIGHRRTAGTAPLPLNGVGWVCGCTVLIMAASVTWSNVADFHRAPGMRQYYERMVPYAFSAAPMPIDARGNTPFHATPEETAEALRVLQRYRLSFFAERAIDVAAPLIVLNHGNPAPNVRIGEGWHQPGEQQRWVAGRSEIAFRAGAEGRVTVEGYLPAFLSPNTITLQANGVEFASQPATDGTFTVTGLTAPNQDITLAIIVENHVVPRAIGLNADERDLGALIKNIVTH